MLKTITLENGREVKFLSNALIPMRYQRAFKQNYFQTIVRFSQSDPSSPNLQTIYRMAWVFAKNADSSIGDLDAWLNSFDDFPLLEVVDILEPLIENTVSSQKEKHFRR